MTDSKNTTAKPEAKPTNVTEMQRPSEEMQALNNLYQLALVGLNATVQKLEAKINSDK